jgi:hypothetical protein
MFLSHPYLRFFLQERFLTKRANARYTCVSLLFSFISLLLLHTILFCFTTSPLHYFSSPLQLLLPHFITNFHTQTNSNITLQGPTLPHNNDGSKVDNERTNFSPLQLPRQRLIRTTKLSLSTSLIKRNEISTPTREVEVNAKQKVPYSGVVATQHSSDIVQPKTYNNELQILKSPAQRDKMVKSRSEIYVRVDTNNGSFQTLGTKAVRKSFSIQNYEKEKSSLHDTMVTEVLHHTDVNKLFVFYLNKNHMKEPFDVYLHIQIMSNLPFSHTRQKTKMFLELCQTFLIRGCPRPLGVPYILVEEAMCIYRDLLVGKISTVPLRFLKQLENETWSLLHSSCLSPFIVSEMYATYKLNLIEDVEKDEFSRSKIEDFFGVRMYGPLHRCEELSLIPVSRNCRSFSRRIRQHFLLHELKSFSGSGGSSGGSGVSNLKNSSTATSTDGKVKSMREQKQSDWAFASVSLPSMTAAAAAAGSPMMRRKFNQTFTSLSTTTNTPNEIQSPSCENISTDNTPNHIASSNVSPYPNTPTTSFTPNPQNTNPNPSRPQWSTQCSPIMKKPTDGGRASSRSRMSRLGSSRSIRQALRNEMAEASVNESEDELSRPIGFLEYVWNDMDMK